MIRCKKKRKEWQLRLNHQKKSTYLIVFAQLIQVSSQNNHNFSGNSSATVLNHLLKGGDNSLEIAFVVGLIPNGKETVFLIKKSCSANPLSSFRPSVDYIVPGEMELTSAVRCVLVDRPTHLI